MPIETDTRDMLASLRFSPPVKLPSAPALGFKLLAATGEIAGYASTFAGLPDSFGEVVRKGAFRRTIAQHRAAGSQPVMLWSHDVAAPIGRWVEAREDDVGLFVRGLLNMESTRGKEAHAHLKGGDISGLSIGFRVAEDGRIVSGGVATLTDVDVLEISVVALPANSRARVVEVKSLGSKRELEDLLHGAGLAKGAADRIARGGWPALIDEQQPHCILCGNTKAEASTLIRGPQACICIACAEETIRLSGMNERKSMDTLLSRLMKARTELKSLKGFGS